jgi:hypothetical protein
MDALKKRRPTRAATRNQPKHDPNVPIFNTPRHKTRINFALINTVSIAALTAILARAQARAYAHKSVTAAVGAALECREHLF